MSILHEVVFRMPTGMRVANEREPVRTNSMRDEKPSSAVLCRASVRRIRDMSSAIGHVRWLYELN